MKADSADQKRLIDLVEFDRKIIQINHQRQTIPELNQLKDQVGTYRKISAEVVAYTTDLSDQEKALAEVEQDLGPAKSRLERNEQRVSDGSISEPKALNSLLDEIAHLKKRIHELEDQQLELMQHIEDLTKARNGLVKDGKVIESKVKELVKTRDEKLSVLDQELAETKQLRTSLTADLPKQLVESYEKIAARNAGIGAGQLIKGKCSGCGLEASPNDLVRYAKTSADQVVHCEECGRILVRA